MSLVLTVVVVAAVLVLALALAYLPMRLLVAQMARNVAAPIRDFMQRQRERRAQERHTPDRRKVL